MAERDGRTRVTIVPAGFTYVQREQWHITLRFGPALLRDDYPDSAHLVRAIEKRVHDLSDLAVASAPTHTQEAVQL